MIRINLLPIRQIKKREKARQEVLIFAISLVVIFIGMGVDWLFLSQKVEALQAAIQQIETEKKQLQAVVDQIKKLQQQKEGLEKKLATIASLKAKSKIPVRVLDELANILPVNRLWLKSLTQSGAGLQLSGVALDNATIAEYMRNFGKSPYFAEPQLTKSALEVIAGQNLKSFSLTVGIGPKQESPLQEKPKEASPKVKKK